MTIYIPHPTNETAEQIANSFLLSEEQQLYKDYLIAKLGEPRERDGFKSEISKELRNGFGVHDWALAPLGLPSAWSASWQVGVINTEYTTIYTENHFFNVDLILQHLNNSNTPVFFSDVITSLKSLPFLSDNHEHYKKIANLNRDFGYIDSCNIPITSSYDGSRVVLSLTSKNTDPTRFKSYIKRNLRSVHTFARAVNEVAIIKHSDTFGIPYKEFESMSAKDGLDLLVDMGLSDIDALKCFEKRGLSASTGNRKLKDFRDSLNVKTNQGAIIKAVLTGLMKIKPTKITDRAGLVDK